MLIVIRGAGDIATGIGWRLWRCGFDVVMTDLPQPTCIRRTVAFSTALEEGEYTVEGVTALACPDLEAARAALAKRCVAVIPDPEGACIKALQPAAVVDAVLAKKNLGTAITDAPLVIGVGPGFCAGQDCHYVVETKRGHRLGRVIEEGPAAPNSGLPGNIMGYTGERIIRSTVSGRFEPLCAIGDLVQAGQTVARVDDVDLKVQIPGMIRGMLHEGIQVTPGFKCGDVDPRGREADYTTISDKARAVAGGVLEAVLRRYGSRMQ